MSPYDITRKQLLENTAYIAFEIELRDAKWLKTCYSVTVSVQSMIGASHKNT